MTTGVRRSARARKTVDYASPENQDDAVVDENVSENDSEIELIEDTASKNDEDQEMLDAPSVEQSDSSQKNNSDSQKKIDVPSSQDVAVATPKRRGRPPKSLAKQQNTPQSQSKQQKSDTPKRRGRPPKNGSKPASSAPQTPKTPSTRKPRKSKKKDDDNENDEDYTQDTSSKGKSRKSKDKEDDADYEDYKSNDDASNNEDEDDGDEEYGSNKKTPRSRASLLTSSSYPAKRPKENVSVQTEHILSHRRKLHGSIITQVNVMVGHDPKNVTRMVYLRENWDQFMFIPHKKAMGLGAVMPINEVNDTNRVSPIPNVHSTNDEILSGQELKPMTVEDASKYLIQPKHDHIVVNDQQVYTFESVTSYESDFLESIVLNTGGVVTSISWANGIDDPSRQILAVGLLDDNNRDPISSSIINPEISIFSKNSYPSSVYIYQVDLSESTLENEMKGLLQSRTKLIYTLSADFGSCIKLAWRPVSSSSDIEDNSIGHLAILSQDGGLRLYKIPDPESTDKTIRYNLTKPLREYFTVSSSPTSQVKTLTFCWRTPNVLSIATNDGQVGEYDVTDSSELFAEPSFYITLYHSAISTISSGYPNNSNLLFVSSTDGLSTIFDVRNLNHRNINHRKKGFSVASSYNPHFEGFISIDDGHHSNISFVRFFRAHMYSNSLTNHRGIVTSIASSMYHPFIVTGGTDGEIICGNITRRVLSRKRVAVNPYEQGHLWAVDYSTKEDVNSEGKYIIKNVFRSDNISKPKSLSIQQTYPHNITIKDSAWSTCLKSAEWYAAATTGGIIKFHRLFYEENEEK